MGFFDWLTNTTDDTDDVPPKPDDYSDSKEETHAYYRTELEYRNGDTETLCHYGIRGKDGDEILFNVDPYASRAWRGPSAYSKFRTESRSFEVLSREPETEQIGEHTFELSWDVEHELKNENWSHRKTEWEPQVSNYEMERIDGE